MLKVVKNEAIAKGHFPLVPLEHLTVEEGFNVRTKKNAEPDAELIATVKFRGVLSPIHIREDKDGNYLIIDGHRRFRAAQLSGNTKAIPAINHGHISDQEALIISLTLTDNQKSFSKREMMDACKRLKNFNMTVEEISKVLCKTKSTISVYLSAAKATPKLRKAAEEGRVSVKSAAKASKLPKAEQKKIVKKAEGKTPEEVEEVIEEARQRAQPRRPGVSKAPPPPQGSGPAGMRMRQPGEAGPVSEYKVVADYKERCRKMEEEIQKRIRRTPSNKILQGLNIFLAVMKGKMTVEQAFINWETV